MFETVRVEIDGGLGKLTLNRAEKLNPLSTVTPIELADAARWFDAQAQVKVVVVSGAELGPAVAELARSLAAKASFPLLATRRHVNAVTEQMGGPCEAGEMRTA